MPQKEILVSFLIATQNRAAVLLNSLRHVLECGMPGKAFEIIVVDNASDDGTAERLTAEFPQVKLLKLPKNFGPVAKTLAIKGARGEFIVFLDDDAYPLPGAILQMIQHFRQIPELGAAIFDVRLPDGSRESSAYPDVFIGAGTGLRRTALQQAARDAHGSNGSQIAGLPLEFFMQAEEYDLSFRLLDAGWQIKRFSDMGLLHLKTPEARIGCRTTRLDVRNNLLLLAKYVLAPLCHQLAADWLSRYFLMAAGRDAVATGIRKGSRMEVGHRKAFMEGAAQGFRGWNKARASSNLIRPATLEIIFKSQEIESRLRSAQCRFGFKRLIFADFGKNILPFYAAANKLSLNIAAVMDDRLLMPLEIRTGAGNEAAMEREYRGIPLITSKDMQNFDFDAILITNMSPVQARERTRTLRPRFSQPVIDLFEMAPQIEMEPLAIPAVA